MPIFTTPAADFHEYNHCHAPDSGQFCASGGGVSSGGGSVGQARLAPGALPYNPSRYFEIDARTQLVPLEKVRTIRARPDGIAHAETLMQRAYRGLGDKREPITVERLPDGTYRVLNGNSTTAIARKHKWPKIVVRVQ